LVRDAIFIQGDGQWLFSDPLLEVLRSIPTQVGGSTEYDSYLVSVKEAIQNKFGKDVAETISRSQIIEITSLYKKVSIFVPNPTATAGPGIAELMEKTTKGGAVCSDLVGLGAKNLRQVMLAMVRPKNGRSLQLDEAISALEPSLKAVDAELDDLVADHQHNLIRFLKDSVSMDASRAGDDIFAYLKNGLSDVEARRLVDFMGERLRNPGAYRDVILPAGIESSRSGDLLNTATEAIKSIRKRLEEEFSYRTLKEIYIACIVKKQANGEYRYELEFRIAGRNPPPHFQEKLDSLSHELFINMPGGPIPAHFSQAGSLSGS
jgi:hypothetical protein